MELDGTRLGVFSAEKMHLNLNSGAMSLSEIMTRLLKITHRYCCERFHIETFFFWEACSYSWMRAQPRRRTPIMFTSCTVTTSSRWSMIRCKRGATVCGYNLVERKKFLHEAAHKQSLWIMLSKPGNGFWEKTLLLSSSNYFFLSAIHFHLIGEKVDIIWLISPKLCNSQQNKLDGQIALWARGKNMSFWFLGWTAPLSRCYIHSVWMTHY